MAKDRPHLFDRTVAPGATWRLDQPPEPGGPIHPYAPVDPAFQRAVRSAKRVVADETSEFYWLSAKGKWSVTEDPMFRRLLMPFPSVWIEWIVPATIMAAGQVQHRKQASLAGVLLESFPPGENASPRHQRLWSKPWPPTTANVIHVTFIETESLGGVPYYSALGGAYGIDAAGSVTTHEPTFSRQIKDPTTTTDPYFTSWYKVISRQAIHGMKPALLALHFMNYKNVALVDHQPARVRSSKSQLRKERPGLRYSTIRLPSTATRTLAKMRSVVQQGVALHEVRAHDKTYTAEAPLLGKHVGTYLWGMQVRGAPEHGTVVSDYEVGLPPEG